MNELLILSFFKASSAAAFAAASVLYPFSLFSSGSVSRSFSGSFSGSVSPVSDFSVSSNGCSAGLNQLSKTSFSSSNSLFSVSNLGFAWSSKSGYSNIGFPESSTFSGIPSSAA